MAPKRKRDLRHKEESTYCVCATCVVCKEPIPLFEARHGEVLPGGRIFSFTGIYCPVCETLADYHSQDFELRSRADLVPRTVQDDAESLSGFSAGGFPAQPVGAPKHWSAR